ncbi:MAG TPA: NAD(P)H-hydrate dehydratase [Polyangiaceae bacterium]|nr:NAD(P)H-hydrate dehydratase [Polyangiaceae bacterium]
MQPILSREQIRDFDRHAIEVCSVPSLLLMENAGRGAAELVHARLADHPGRVFVVCGPGNNGGDGFVVARLLAARGADVRVALVASPARLSGDAKTNHAAWVGVGGDVLVVGEADLERLEEELSRAAILVDALFGTGLDRPVSGHFASVIDRVNRAPAWRIALDVPSGMDANTGGAQGAIVRADETVTFAHLKLGLATSAGAERAGPTTVVDIGVPSLAAQVGSSARFLEAPDVASWIGERPLATHKGAAGRVVIVGGSAGKTGAALLSARGSLRAGAGLVTIAAFPDTARLLDARVLEEMTARIDEQAIEASLDGILDAADAVVVGPGMGLDARARTVAEHVVLRHEGTLVVDADGLSHFSGRLAEMSGAKGKLILTPHPGELGRLLGITAAEVEADRFGAVRTAVAQSGAVVLLKGARTVVGSPDGLPVVNSTGSPVLATAGSGDVLSGVLGALAAALGDPVRAACAAACIHGLAGESWEKRSGVDRGLVAHEIADEIPGVLAGLRRLPRPIAP